MLYMGSTNNIEERIKRHNAGRNKFTKNKGPWKLLFSKSFLTRSEAIQLELELKKWKNKKRVLIGLIFRPGSASRLVLKRVDSEN